MKILHINQNYFGNSLHRCLIRESKAHGLDVKVVCFCRKGVDQKDDESVVSFPIIRTFDKVFFLIKCIRCYSVLKKAIRGERFDLIYGHTLFFDGCLSRWLSKRLGIPYIIEVENTDLNAHYKYRVYLRGMARKTLEDAAAVFYFAPSYIEKTLDLFKKSERKRLTNKMYAMPAGLIDFWFENRFYDRQVAETKRIRIASVGDADYNKNHIGIVHAAEYLKQMYGCDVQIEIASSRECFSIVAELRKYPFVHYHGRLSKEGLLELYRRCDVFVLVSHKESFGMVYFEALSQGLPIVYTSRQGVDGYFKKGTVGVAVSATDKIGIANAIYDCYCKRKDLVSTCIKAIDGFDWESVINKHIKIYNLITTDVGA